jgi:hypothetical protein
MQKSAGDPSRVPTQSAPYAPSPAGLAPECLGAANTHAGLGGNCGRAARWPRIFTAACELRPRAVAEAPKRQIRGAGLSRLQRQGLDSSSHASEPVVKTQSVNGGLSGRLGLGYKYFSSGRGHEESKNQRTSRAPQEYVWGPSCSASGGESQRDAGVWGLHWGPSWSGLPCTPRKALQYRVWASREPLWVNGSRDAIGACERHPPHDSINTKPT